MLATEPLDESGVTPELIAELIAAAIASPGLATTTDSAGKTVPVPFFMRFRRRESASRITVVLDVYRLDSTQYIGAEQAEQQAQLEMAAQALKTVLAETPSIQCARVEFVRHKAPNSFHSSNWYTGWGDSETAIAAELGDPFTNKRNPQQTQADGSYSMAAALASTQIGANKGIVDLGKKGMDFAYQAGHAKGTAETLGPELAFWKNRSKHYEDQVDRQVVARAAVDVADKMFSPAVKLAENPNLDKIIISGGTVLDKLLAVLTAAKDAKNAGKAGAQPNGNTPPAAEDDKAKATRVARELNDLIHRGIVTAGDLRRIADQFDPPQEPQAEQPPPEAK